MNYITFTFFLFTIIEIISVSVNVPIPMNMLSNIFCVYVDVDMFSFHLYF